MQRFYRNKSVKEVGATLGISEAAAGKRLSRAIANLGQRPGEATCVNFGSGAGGGAADRIRPSRSGGDRGDAGQNRRAHPVSASAISNAISSAVVRKLTWLKIKFFAGVTLGAAVLCIVAGAAVYKGFPNSPGISTPAPAPDCRCREHHPCVLPSRHGGLARGDFLRWLAR